jgi:HlyD family secretion protein
MPNRMMTTLARFKIPLILFAVAVLALVWLMQKPAAENTVSTQAVTQAPKTALTVSTVKPMPSSMAVTIPATGSIAAWQEAVIGAEVNGLLLKDVMVNVGDMVKKGQVIARFSTSNIDADIAQASANLAEAKAALLEAASNATRARGIQNTGALSAQQIDQYLTAEASAKARVEAAQAGLNVQQVKLKQTTVYAPDSGIISARTATVGAVASAGQELFKLIRQGRLEWRAELTSADVNQLKVGMPATLTLPDGQSLQGKVRAFAPNVDAQTRNAIVYVDIPNQGAKAGMFARGQFTLSNSQAFTLPNSAIVMRDGFAYVMQVMPNQTVKQLKVNLGRRSGNAVEVLDLTAQQGDFVNSGGAFLVDGDAVKVVISPKQQVAE